MPNKPFACRSLGLIALTALVLPLAAQELSSGSPESVGLSPERLDRIAAAVQKEIDNKRIAGAVTLVARKGKVAWFKAQGMADREAGKPMTTDSIFRICSMSKALTSTAVMMLYEEGRFLLDDPISKFIPEFKDPKVLVKDGTGRRYSIPAKSEITIRELLTHTSGLTYQWNPDLGQQYHDANVASGLMQYDGTIGDSVKRLASLPLLFNPGEKFEYSLGVDVLGYLVEVVSGKSFADFLRERVTEPLGMKDTYFFVPEEKQSRLATVYTYYDGKGLNRFPNKPIVEGPFEYTADYPYRGPKKLYSGGAGLNSTAMDYARFCQMMLSGGRFGGKQLLSRKSVELMTHDQLGKISPDFAFGLGFGVAGIDGPLHELGSVGEYNWGGFYYTDFTIDPKEDMITVFMAQLHPTGGLELNTVFHTLAYQALAN